MVYRHILPANRTYYMTARKHRFYGPLPHEELKDEVIPQPLDLLRVCHLVNQELRSLVHDQCIFYITIYSIRDLLCALDLLDGYETFHTTPHSTDIFSRMSNIRVRVNDLVLNIRPRRPGLRRGLIAEHSQTTPLWTGPGGKSILNNRAQAAETMSMYEGYEGERIPSGYVQAVELKNCLRMMMLRDHVLDKSILERMLPWYQRYQRQHRHKLSASLV
jgi:hypothetical protein